MSVGVPKTCSTHKFILPLNKREIFAQIGAYELAADVEHCRKRTRAKMGKKIRLFLFHTATGCHIRRFSQYQITLAIASAEQHTEGLDAHQLSRSQVGNYHNVAT